MEVILLERIEKLGLMGDVVSVKAGYARNYLLPQNKALRATEENRKGFDARRTQLEATNVEHRKEAAAVGEKLEGLSVVLVRQAGEAGQLYGSVKARDIAEKVTEAGFTVERRQISLDRPIKSVGLYDLRVNLHPEVAVTVKANIARSEEEAKIQAETGRAVIYQEEEKEPVEEAAPGTGEEAEGSEKGAEEPAAAADAPAAKELAAEPAAEPAESGAPEAASEEKSQ